MDKIDYSDESLKSVFYHDSCDKYDYLIAVGSGAIAGIVDIFFVGSPTDSKLQAWTDSQVDKTVITFAKVCGWSPKEGKEKNISSAIGFLEKKFKVNYDQRHSGDVNGIFKMSTKNHHIKSLGHSPDILGLFFSILNQFTSTSSFLNNGQLITIKTDKYELQGNNFISKIFSGITNWFGHIMSDIAGSSGASERGSGLAIPFYQLLQLCNFGSFKDGENRNTIATIATKVFEEGYDARFGITMSIPVLLCDLSVKLIWTIKQHFYHNRPLKECIPRKRHNGLRLMLLISNGVLCLMDGVDAAIRSAGNWIKFFLRLNLIAWTRFIILVFREVCIRLGISSQVQEQLNTYNIINEELKSYLLKLKQIDIEKFKIETEMYNNLMNIIKSDNCEMSLSILLKSEYEALGIELPYSGSFDSFMKNKNSVLEFK